MPIYVLDIHPVRDLDTDLVVAKHVNFEIWEAGGPHYLYGVGNAPAAIANKSQAETWLLNRFDELLAGAIGKDVIAPDNILDNPNIDWRKALLASLLVILGQINVLREEAGLPAISKQQAYAAIKAQYQELD
jgi:hypothetical protein